jgi:hypothetical protein
MACLLQDAIKIICRWSDVETPSQTFVPERNRATITETGGSRQKIMLGQRKDTSVVASSLSLLVFADTDPSVSEDSGYWKEFIFLRIT